jgi:zinc protease
MTKMPKKKPRISLLLIVTVLALGGCKKTISGYGVNLEIQSQTLPNGLRVIMLEDHKAPIISYQTWLRIGSVDELPGKQGISHFCEHLMFKSSPKFGPQPFFTLLEDKGAEINGLTTRDYTVFYEDFTPNLLNQVIDLEADRMANFKLDEDSFSTERMVVLEEIRQGLNSPEGKLQEALWALAYKRHPYRNPIGGFAETLMTLSMDTVREWVSRYYQPGNAVLVIAGDFDSKTTLARIEKAYGPLKGSPVQARVIDSEPEQNEEHRLVLKDEVATERFAQAYHITSANDEDSYAIDVLSNVLFEGMSSRAWRRLVEKEEVADAVGASSFTPLYPGLFMISVRMKQGIPSAKAEKSLDELIRDVQENGVSQDEVNKAVKQLTVQMVDTASSIHGIGQFIGLIVTVIGDPARFSEDLTKYLRVTPSDVKRVAEKYLVPNNRSIVFVQPEERKGKK